MVGSYVVGGGGVICWLVGSWLLLSGVVLWGVMLGGGELVTASWWGVVIGRAWRWGGVYISVVAGSLKKKCEERRG